VRSSGATGAITSAITDDAIASAFAAYAAELRIAPGGNARRLPAPTLTRGTPTSATASTLGLFIRTTNTLRRVPFLSKAIVKKLQ